MQYELVLVGIEIIKFITDIKDLIMQLLLWIIYKVIKVGGISKEGYYWTFSSKLFTKPCLFKKFISVSMIWIIYAFLKVKLCLIKILMSPDTGRNFLFVSW